MGGSRPFRHRGGLAAFLAAVLFIFSTTTIQASRVRPLNIEEMSGRATRVFSGRCLDVRVERDPALGQVVTHVTLAVTRAAKGDLRGRLTIRLLGDQDLDGDWSQGTDGLPRFRRGEEVVLFLYGDSASGLTSPVGFGQGKFGVVEDDKGGKVAVNGFGNAGLMRGLTPEAQRRIGRAEPPGRGRPVFSPDELLDMVERLEEE